MIKEYTIIVRVYDRNDINYQLILCAAKCKEDVLTLYYYYNQRKNARIFAIVEGNIGYENDILVNLPPHKQKEIEALYKVEKYNVRIS